MNIMRTKQNRLVGMAYSKPLINLCGYLKCPCITTGLAHYYSQKQLYPMVIEIYEKSICSNTRS